MARFLIWADLHNEFHLKLPDLPDDISEMDGILLAGDVSTGGRQINVMADLWDASHIPVRMVYGNHEFYGQNIQDLKVKDAARVKALRASGMDIGILDCGEEIIAGTRILGCTLWTDINLYPELGPTQDIIVEKCMMDFRAIKVTWPGEERLLSAKDVRAMHEVERDWLLERLAEPGLAPTLVMTHHLPCKELLHPSRCHGEPIEVASNAGFASDLWPRIKDRAPDVWVSGHSHDNTDWSPFDGKTLFIQNSRGYPGERRPWGAREFNEGLILEVKAPEAPEVLADVGPPEA